MRVMVVGAGAREHALAWRLRAEGCELWCAPGNGGTPLVARTVAVGSEAIGDWVDAASRERIDLVIVGPEAPLVGGLVDALTAAGIAAFGPTADCARLEGSKVFAKQFMQRHGIPTAAFAVFDDADAADGYIRAAARPLVVKADGLAGGKGVVVATDTQEALAAVDAMMRQRIFGEAGCRIVIEECLLGEEISYHIVVDGETFVALAAAQDHKRIFEGDRGANTGGMGACSPPRIFDAAMETQVLQQVVEPTLRGLQRDGMHYRGALFIGLMVQDGMPRVLEYNVRFGDPECEALVMRLGSSLSALLQGAAHGGEGLQGVRVSWAAPAALCVVLAAPGYPQAPQLGSVITGLEGVAEDPHIQVFHAGTRRSESGWHTAGGRVLTVAACGDDVDQAAQRAYSRIEHLDFAGKQWRRDIGWRSRNLSQLPSLALASPS